MSVHPAGEGQASPAWNDQGNEIEPKSCLGVVPEEKGSSPDAVDLSETATPRKMRRRDSSRFLSADRWDAHEDSPHHGHPPLQFCLIVFVAMISIVLGFIVAGLHKLFIYSGCPLGINGCNSLNSDYEKKGFMLQKILPEVPEDVIYIVCAVVGSLICGVIAWPLSEHLQQQVLGGGSAQSLIAVATGESIPFRAVALRLAVTTIFLMSGGSLGAEGPAIQICTSFAMQVGWYCGIRAAVTQSLLASLGFSCGFAASFNAPIAGTLFAMEELQHVSKRLTQSTIYLILLTSLLSTSAVRALGSNSHLFSASLSQEIQDQVVGGSINAVYGDKMWMLIAIPIGATCSLAGYVISLTSRRLHAWLQTFHKMLPLPLVFVVQGLVVASIGAAVWRTTELRGVWGIGAESLQKIFEKDFPASHLMVFAAGKAAALVLGTAARCPADMLEPVLITGGFIGGTIGYLVPFGSTLASADAVTPCIFFGMVGLFASCFRFPLTPIVMVLELTGIETYSVILPAALCSFTAVVCSDHLFPALLEDVLIQEGIDLEALAQEAEEHYQEEDEREHGEQGDDQAADSEEDERSSKQNNSSDGREDESGDDDNQVPPIKPRARANSNVSNFSSAIHQMLGGLEESLLVQSRPAGARSPPLGTSPCTSRRPSFNAGRRPSNEAQRGRSQSKDLHGKTLTLNMIRSQSHDSIASNESRGRSPPGGRGSIGDGMLEVPLQSLPSGRGGLADLRFTVQVVPSSSSSEPSLLLQVQHQAQPRWERSTSNCSGDVSPRRCSSGSKVPLSFRDLHGRERALSEESSCRCVPEEAASPQDGQAAVAASCLEPPEIVIWQPPEQGTDRKIEDETVKLDLDDDGHVQVQQQSQLEAGGAGTDKLDLDDDGHVQVQQQSQLEAGGAGTDRKIEDETVKLDLDDDGHVQVQQQSQLEAGGAGTDRKIEDETVKLDLDDDGHVQVQQQRQLEAGGTQNHILD
eukprot:TRINITY_DN12807_c0_g1_i6.p1 TRINITY_DN12807_c0_g1~~TRINITY_DN12807_c0_g1_i6.p1  ORF type:complete len:976 (+),score=164.25 TRINITY_DN12807_c0_g1_i6:65-2992(+)